MVQGPFFLLQESSNTQSKRRLVLRFDFWGMATNSVFAAEGRYRVLLEHAVRTTERDFTNEFRFKPNCDKHGEPLWRDHKRRTFSTMDLVELSFIELFDTANKLQNGEPLTYVPEID